MKQLTHYLLPLLFGIAFMSLQSIPARAAENAKVLAIVDGHKITQDMYETYVKRRGIKDLKNIKEEQRKTIIDELVNRELLYWQAITEKLDNDPEVKSELDNIRRNLFASAAIRTSVLEKRPITEAMMKQEYDKQVKILPTKEFKARHILTKEKKDADVVIQELKKGAVFAELAKLKSTGPTGKDGGDLGWFREGQMIPEFTDAVSKLKTGSYSAEPVKTLYGWHVILLEDERDAPAPSFDELKNQIKMSLSNQQLGNYINSLKATAKIEIK